MYFWTICVPSHALWSFSCMCARLFISIWTVSVSPAMPTVGGFLSSTVLCVLACRLFIMASAYLLVPLKDSTPVFFKTPLHPCVHSLCRLGASLCLFTLVVGRSRLGRRENTLTYVPLQFPVQRHTSLVCVHVDRVYFFMPICLLG